MAPSVTISGRAPGASGCCRGTAMERIASCTMPTFSKMEVTLSDTQPAMLDSCQASGSAMATVPTLTAPRVHSQTASTPVPTTMQAFRACSVSTNTP